MQTELMPGGRWNYCTGCTQIDLRGRCGEKDLSANNKYADALAGIGVTKALCCSECKVIEAKQLGDYFGMPSGAGAGAPAGALGI